MGCARHAECPGAVFLPEGPRLQWEEVWLQENHRGIPPTKGDIPSTSLGPLTSLFGHLSGGKDFPCIFTTEEELDLARHISMFA